MDENCQVSIICITYNQIAYLPKAVESMLSQKTDFEYEIIIHDDDSTDGTRKYIEELILEYPDKIRAVLEDENQYSKGTDFFAYMIRNVAKGKYIATCEGDDYWIDDNKLQLQYEALEKHPECDMCACWGCTVTEDGKEVSQIRPIEHDGVLPVEDVILGGGQYLVTASLFLRKKIYDNMLLFEKVIPLDYAQQIKGALRGGIYYIDRKMAVYRRYSKGSWTNEVLKDNIRLSKQWDKEKQILETLDVDTDYKYHSAIVERLKAYVPFETQLEDNKKEVISLLREVDGSCYLWGLGRRGKSLEHFIDMVGLDIDGVCDAINQNIGEKTEYGNCIFSTDYVLENADNIIASTQFAYDDLMKLNLEHKTILNFQQYMPYG